MAVELPSLTDLQREIRTQAAEGYTPAVITRRLVELHGLTEEVAAAMVSRALKKTFDPEQHIRKTAAITGALLFVPGLAVASFGLWLSSSSQMWAIPVLIGLLGMGVGGFRLSWAFRLWGN